jgi:hypothetical protein
MSFRTNIYTSHNWHNFLLIGRYTQEYTNPGCQIAQATDVLMVATEICGSSVKNLLHATFLVPRILRWLLDVWKICAPLDISIKCNKRE